MAITRRTSCDLVSGGRIAAWTSATRTALPACRAVRLASPATWTMSAPVALPATASQNGRTLSGETAPSSFEARMRDRSVASGRSIRTVRLSRPARVRAGSRRSPLLQAAMTATPSQPNSPSIS